MSAPEIRGLFERNASTYDPINSVIGLGLDAGWRRWVAARATSRDGARVLDAFAGTGEVGIEAAAMGAVVTLADFSERMLAIAEQRANAMNIAVQIENVDLTSERLPFKKNSFDAITLSFGLRYLDDPSTTLARLRSLLRRDGKLIVLEFVTPEPGLIATPASFYFFRILPRIGSILASGRRELYDYLASSVKALGREHDLAATVGSAGLDIREMKRFGCGLVCALVAEKSR